MNDKTFNGIKGINNINLNSLITDQGGYSLDQQRDDNPPFFTEHNRSLYTDDQLIKDSTREAQVHTPTTTTVDWDGDTIMPRVFKDRTPVTYKPTAMQKLQDAVAKLSTLSNGYRVGEYVEATAQVQYRLTNLMYGKDQDNALDNGKQGPYYKRVRHITRRWYVHGVIAEAMERAFNESEQSTCATYIEDDPYLEETEYTPEPEPSMSFNPVDHKWSNRVVDYIINTMDPHGTGIATHTMTFKGTYHLPKKYKKPGKIKHMSPKQSLVWLMGPRGKQGFMSHPGLTKDDREVLQDFVSASWAHYKRG